MEYTYTRNIRQLNSSTNWSLQNENNIESSNLKVCEQWTL